MTGANYQGTVQTIRIVPGPVEFDLAHVAETVCEHYPSVNQGLLEEIAEGLASG